jgi:hypothetical protein
VGITQHWKVQQLTKAQIWVRLVTKVLKHSTSPISVHRLRHEIQGVLDADSRLGKSLPDKTFLDWMVKKQIIQRYHFSNRKSDYYALGVPPLYDQIRDAPTEDLVDLGASPPFPNSIPDKDSSPMANILPPRSESPLIPTFDTGIKMLSMEEIVLKLEDQDLHIAELEERIKDLEEISYPVPVNQTSTKKTKSRKKSQ